MYFRAYSRDEKRVIEERFSIKGEVTLFDILHQFSLDGIYKDLIIEQYTDVDDNQTPSVEVCENDIVAWDRWYLCGGDHEYPAGEGRIYFDGGSFWIEDDNAPELNDAEVINCNIRVVGRVN